ncbi:hypothetical protein LCGC14_0714900 [marine sediment metagenome]|uniref:Band 7 domain-containing protein n=1 Tax=marine sediment metagenome TaxID=412755 RepID=A0A0F9QE35_9ZZZZ
MAIYMIILFGGFVLFVFACGIRVINEYHRGIRLRFGKFLDVLQPGLRWVIPFIDIIPRRVDIRERVIDMRPQATLTKDKVSLTIDAIVMWKIKQGKGEEDILENCRKNELEVKNVKNVMQQKAEAQLREAIASRVFSEVLEKKEEIATKIRNELDEATDRWGVDVTSVQIRDIKLPDGMKRAMALKAEADIEKEARETKAEAEMKAFEIMEKIGKIAQKNPAILELRRLQTISEIGAEQNTTTVVMLPEVLTNSLKR